jgi:ubiquinone/menaquinone biosynthesis C-methylase UbiE
MESQSFDGLVDLYDETRCFDRGCFDAALDYLAECFPPQTHRNVFEPGIGTGRIAVPLAERGYSVTGVDVSPQMLAVLRDRLRETSLPICAEEADVTRLPFSDAIFDLAVVVHLFYFIQDWRKAVDEVLRVVRRDGAVILMHTGLGAEVPALNSRYKELCTDQGYAIEPVGVSSTAEVVGYMSGIGCRIEAIGGRWTWTARIPLGRAIHYLDARAYSFTARTPDDIHQAAISRLSSEYLEMYGSLTHEAEVPNQISLVVVTR